MKDQSLLDNGLTRLSNSANWAGALKVAVCRTEPTLLAHCTDVEGTAVGKRVTGEHQPTQGMVVLGDRIPSGREITIAAAPAAAQGVVNTTLGDDLWYAVYDNSTLYQTINESSDKAINVGDDVDFGEIKIGYANDA